MNLFDAIAYISFVIIIYTSFFILEKIEEMNVTTKEIYWLLPSDSACSNIWDKQPKLMIKNTETGKWVEAKFKN